MRAIAIQLALTAAAVVAATCGPPAGAGVAPAPPKVVRVGSVAFSDGGTIPPKYTADALNVSPPLDWSGAPPATKSYALIMDDPDAPAGIWTHWVMWNLDETQLAENVPPSPTTSTGAFQGRNSWGRIGYGGPAPPSGTHRYHFRVYALDARLTLPGDTDADDLRRAMHGHVLAFGELMGKYGARK